MSSNGRSSSSGSGEPDSDYVDRYIKLEDDPPPVLERAVFTPPPDDIFHVDRDEMIEFLKASLPNPMDAYKMDLDDLDANISVLIRGFGNPRRRPRKRVASSPVIKEEIIDDDDMPDIREQSPTPSSSSKTTNDDYIDTVELSKRIGSELKKYQISQADFAEVVLGRSQGTLSDLLRNPKPWESLKNGKDTFVRMKHWIDLSHDLKKRTCTMAIGELYKILGVPSPVRTTKRSVSPEYSPTPKRHRLVFTEYQKTYLKQIFRETQRPSKEMQMRIGKKLGLDRRTVSNFFMNGRRRSRNNGHFE